MSEKEAEKRPVAAELREYALGRLPKQKHRDINSHAGLVDDRDVSEWLSMVLEARRSGMLERDVAESYVGRITPLHATEMAGDMMMLRNELALSYFTGLVGYKKDVAGIQALQNMVELILRNPVAIFYLFGPPGFGKSNFALLLAELVLYVYETLEGEEVKVISNIPSWEEAHEVINDTPALEKELIEGRSDDLVRLIVIDEASQKLSGAGADQSAQRELAKLLFLARRANANVIFIGHDGKDVGPSIRALCAAVVEKEGLKQATFYRDVVNREGVGKIMSLSKIPETNMTYWDEDVSEWYTSDEMGVDESDEDVEALQKRLEELEAEHVRKMMAMLGWQSKKSEGSGLTQAEIGEIYGVSDKTVRRNMERYEGEFAHLFDSEGSEGSK